MQSIGLKQSNLTELLIILQECIKNVLDFDGELYYYCSFSEKKEYYSFDKNIVYLGRIKNKFLKFLEFRLLIIFKTLQLVVGSDSNVLMCNQDLVKYLKPAIFLNKLLGKIISLYGMSGPYPLYLKLLKRIWFNINVR